MRVTCKIQPDEFTDKLSHAFDYDFNGESYFDVPEIPNKPKDFNIGLLVGNSGSGKSLLLDTFGKEKKIKWDNNKAVISHFDNPDEAIEKVFAVGLSSIPSLCKPYSVLSNGEKFRADMARKLHDNSVIDEFTSVVNRETAFSVSTSISKYIKRKVTVFLNF